GQHPTTRTALELLQRIPVRGAVLDAGCGSGILAIAARRLGFGPVVAIDFDPDSVAATARAARANMVHGIDVRRAVIGEDPLPIAPVLLANITLEVLTVLAQQIAGAPAPGASEAPGAAVAPGAARTSPACAVEHAVLSGLREHEVDAAVAAFAPLGLAEAERMPEDGWASVRLQA
ncbi:MAG: 50S ribosomal protein L11 methyltransferase, partial [Actinomycetota bacterium]